MRLRTTGSALLGTLWLLLLPSGLSAQVPVPEGEVPSLEERAVAWMNLLRDEEFDRAAAQVSPAARAQMSGDQLAQLWPMILERHGELGDLEPVGRLTQGAFEIVQLQAHFDRGLRIVRVAFDADGLVAGFFVLDAPGGGR
ncbi:MAG: DUF3887 domain-containing protein [Gemmatimonadetes bacterium]|nr:MAG: DUF3887 domain-containing protein [Gemmatimonadota bacterium]